MRYYTNYYYSIINQRIYKPLFHNIFMKSTKAATKRGIYGARPCLGKLANTNQLFRIITFLREQTIPVCKTDIGLSCCLNMHVTDDALLFLVRSKMVRKFMPTTFESSQRHIIKSNTKVYEISNKYTAQNIIDSLESKKSSRTASAVPLGGFK